MLGTLISISKTAIKFLLSTFVKLREAWSKIPEDEQEKIIKEVSKMFRDYFSAKYDEYHKNKQGRENENKK